MKLVVFSLAAGLASTQSAPTPTTVLSPEEQHVLALNQTNPHAEFSYDAYRPREHVGGCYTPSATRTAKDSDTLFRFTDQEMARARAGPNIDWRDHGAVGPIQQQHPFGTCWAFSMTAVTEAINVIQGKHKFQKLSEQQTISCVDPKSAGDNADVLWSWAFHHTGGQYQTDAAYSYNRTW